MFEEPPLQQTTPPLSTFRLALSVIIICVTALLIIWVLGVVKMVIYGEENLALLEKIIPDENATVTVESPAGEFKLPREIFIPVAYLILLFFLMIPASIACKLLTGAISLIKPDDLKSLRQLLESVKKTSSG